MNKIRNNTFYPEIILRIEEDINSNKIKVKMDNKSVAILNIDIKNKNIDIKKTFEELSKIKLNNNLIDKKYKELKKSKEIKKEIRQKIYEEYPELKSITPDDEEEFEKLNELIEENLKSKAYELALKDINLKKGSIIKLAGIIKKENNNFIINSKSLYIENNKPKMQGIYYFSVINRKLPLLIKQSKNKKPKVMIHPLTNLNQFKYYVKNQLETIKAFGTKNIKLRNKTYNLTKLPKPYVTYDKNYKENIPEIIDEAIKIININDIENEKIEISPKLENKFKELYGNNIILDKNVDKYFYSFKIFKDFIISNFESNILENFNIYIPLGIKEEEYKNTLNIILKGNKSGKEGRLGIIDSLLNTTFKLYKNDEELISTYIKEKVHELYENSKIQLITTYTTEVNTFVGFFPQNINLKNAVLSIENYTEIIEYLYSKLKNGKK